LIDYKYRNHNNMDGQQQEEGDPHVAEEEELLSAQQALAVLVVAVVVAGILLLRWWRRQQAMAAEDDLLRYEFALPAERQEWIDLVGEGQGKRSNAQWFQALNTTLMKRAIAVLRLHDRVSADYRSQMTLYKRGVAVSTLPEVEAAMKALDAEVNDVRVCASKVKPNWHQTIFADALKLKRGLDEKDAAEQAEQEAAWRQEREKAVLEQAMQLESEEEELKRQKAESELLAETEQELKQQGDEGANSNSSTVKKRKSKKRR